VISARVDRDGWMSSLSLSVTASGFVETKRRESGDDEVVVCARRVRLGVMCSRCYKLYRDEYGNAPSDDLDVATRADFGSGGAFGFTFHLST